MQHSHKHIPCVYFSSSSDGYLVDVNEALCRYLNYTIDELVGQKLEIIFTLSTRIFQQTHLSPLLQLKGHVEEIFITLKSKDGNHVPMLINAQRIEENGAISFHFAGISVSKRKKFEEEIIAAKNSAEKALNENAALKAAQNELEQRAEELDRQIALTKLQNQELKQFNHITTHTLQEPVRKLLFYSSQLLEIQQNKETIAPSLKIRKSSEDIHNKLQGLQQYVLLTDDELKLDQVELFGLLQFCKKMVELQYPNLSINMEAEEIPLIDANSEQMQFLLKELLLNAVKFRKAGDVVNLKVYASTLLLNKFRQLSGKYKYTEFLKLQIQDDGIGFDDQYQEHAFELFRVLNPNGGLGIGLSLCKKIVENHDGYLSLEGQKDVSTTVNIYLPLKMREDLTGKQESNYKI
jgi:sigma-B regulation protein RsbU (phosphoserine phosphatase)